MHLKYTHFIAVKVHEYLFNYHVELLFITSNMQSTVHIGQHHQLDHPNKGKCAVWI